MEEMNWASFFILALFPLGMILYLAFDMYGEYLSKQGFGGDENDKH